MKRKLIVAAMLATTCLTPQKADAGVVSAFVSGLGIAFSGSASAGIVAGLSGGALGAGFATGAFLTSAVGSTLLSFGLSAIAAKLQTQSTPDPSVRMANYAQPVTYAEWFFGRGRKGGPLGFTGFMTGDDAVTGRGGAKRHYTPILAMHRCKGVVEHWLDDEPVEVDANGTVVTGLKDGYYRIRPFGGQPGQLADSELVAQFDEITSDFDFVGLCGAHIWARRSSGEKFNEVYPNARQADYAPVFDGHDDVRDYRTNQSGWTQNAGNIIAKICTDVWGRPVQPDLVAIEADVAARQIPKRGGGLQDLWQVNGMLSDDQTLSAQQAALTVACDVWWYELPNGGVAFKLGRYEEPSLVLTDADFLSVKISTGNSKLGVASEMAAKYVEPANKWKETLSASVVVDSNARQNKQEVDTYLVTNHNQAFRVVRRLAAIEKPDYMLSGTLKSIGRFVRSERFVTMRLAGWPEFVMEVGKLIDNRNGTFNVEGVSVKEDDFAPDVSQIEPERPVYATVASDNAVPDLLGFSGTALSNGQIRYTWAAVDDESLSQRIRWRKTGDLDWQIVPVESGQASLIVTGLGDATIEAQGQNRTGTKRGSNWSPDPADLTDSVINGTAPAALASFDAVSMGFDVQVDFVAPNDPEYRGTRIYRADYDAGYGGPYDIGDADLVQTEYGAAGAADAWTDLAVVAGDHAYWAVPINSSGKPGPRSGPEIVSTM